MKVMVAQSTASALAGHESYRAALCATLEGAGHKVQTLDLPSIAAPHRAITNLAALRLMGTAPSADALICLDAVATVLNHPRKLALLLDDTYLNADAKDLPQERAVDREYIANVLSASLDEAKHLFATSRFAQKRWRALGFKQSGLLRPEFPSARFRYQRQRGPELLVLNVVNDRQRPELLIACLAALPEPFRARWIASRAEPTSLARLLDLARDADVEHRFVVEVRAIDAGEQSYLLSQAAAYLELAPALLAMSERAHEALRLGVPVIGCGDGGALVEFSEAGVATTAKTDGASLAEAVLAARDAPTTAARVASTAQSVSRSWAPLLKALSQ